MGKAKIDVERRALIGQEKRARTRAKILSAAFEVMGAEHGRLARIEDIAKCAGVARPTLYTYFNGVEEVLAALSYELSHDFNIAVTTYCTTLKKHSEHASAAIRFYLRQAAQDKSWGWSMVNISVEGAIFGKDTYAVAYATIEDGIKSGEFNVVNARIGRDLLMGATMAGMISQLKGESDSDDPEQIAKHTLIGLGVSPAKAERISQLPLPDLSCNLQSFSAETL